MKPAFRTVKFRNRIANAQRMVGAEKRAFKAAGFTMVELVIGLVLLATLLVSILMVISRQRKASQLASARQQAVQAADRLLANWFNAQAGIPLVAQGPVVGTNLFWQTRVDRSILLFDQTVPVVRLSIVQQDFDSWNRERAGEMRGASGSQVVRGWTNTELLFIELLAPQGGQ